MSAEPSRLQAPPMHELAEAKTTPSGSARCALIRLLVSPFGACASLHLLMFGFLASLEPVSHDGWMFLLRAKGVGFSARLAGVFEHYSWSFKRMNPRIGELFAEVLYVFPGYALFTACVFVLLLVLLQALSVGHAPSASWRSAGFMLMASALLWWASPAPEHIFFYRAVTANYVYGLVLQLLLFVPLRVKPWNERARMDRPAAAAAMLMVGLLAGLANEHTGPTAILAYAWLARPRHGEQARRPSVGVLAGGVGLVVGYLALFFAHGQDYRYAGAAKQGIVRTILGRGLSGNLQALTDLLAAAWPVPIVIAALLGLALVRRSASRTVLREALWMCGAAAAVFATSLAAPVRGGRLDFAAVALLIMAALRLLAEATTRRTAEIAMIVIGLAVGLGFYGPFATVCYERSREADARWDLLAHAMPGSAVRVSRFTQHTGARFGLSEDFESAMTRERAAKFFGLKEIELSAP